MGRCTNTRACCDDETIGIVTHSSCGCHCCWYSVFHQNQRNQERIYERCRGNSNSSSRQWSMVVCRCGDTVSTFKDLLLFYCQKFSLLESLAILHANIHVDILYVFTLCHCISAFRLPLYPTRCSSSDMFALVRV